MYISYSSGSVDFYIGRQELFILIHYSEQLDADMAEKLYFAAETEYIYRVEKNMPLNGLEYGSSHQPHWDINAFSEVISFIDLRLIPSLEAEVINDIVQILGGWNTLEENINKGAGYKDRFGLVLPENNTAIETYNYIYYANSYKDLIYRALEANKPYYIDYSDDL